MCEFVIWGEPQSEMAGAIISRGKSAGRHWHTNTCIRVFIKTESRVAQDKDKKKWNKKLLRTNRPESRNPICFTHKKTQTSTKSNKVSLQQPGAIWGNSWFLPVFHKGAVIYSHVDDNLIMINSRTAQPEPQQVWDVDTGHTKWVCAHYPVVPCRKRNRLIDFQLLLDRKERLLYQVTLVIKRTELWLQEKESRSQ